MIRLKPGERIGFHRHVLDYFWTAVTGGRGRQHVHDGTTVEYTYAPGETRHETYGPGEFKVHDLENLGDKEMVFMTIEFLRQRQQADAAARRRAAAGRSVSGAQSSTHLAGVSRQAPDAALPRAVKRTSQGRHPSCTLARKQNRLARGMTSRLGGTGGVGGTGGPQLRSADQRPDRRHSARRLLRRRDGRHLDLVRHPRHRQHRASRLHHPRLLHRLYRQHPARPRSDPDQHRHAAGVLSRSAPASIRSTTSRSRSAARKRCAGSPSSSACCSSPR